MSRRQFSVHVFRIILGIDIKIKKGKPKFFKKILLSVNRIYNLNLNTNLYTSIAYLR